MRRAAPALLDALEAMAGEIFDLRYNCGDRDVMGGKTTAADILREYGIGTDSGEGE